MQLRNQKGFTLIEIAIVLTIVGLVIGGIWLAASTVINNNKRQTLNANIVQVVQNVKSLFAGQGSGAVTTGFTQANGVNAGIFPPAMLDANGNPPGVVTPFDASNPATGKDSVTIAASGANGIKLVVGANAGLITTDSCTSLLTTLGSQQNISKLGITSLAGTAGTDLSAGGTAQVTAAAAASACTTAGSGTVGNSVTVIFSAT